jgi:benzylsuccinate CoA-transferase BbsE subunit
MIELHLSMGPAAGTFTNNLFRWLDDEGAVPAHIAAWDWRTVPERVATGAMDLADLDEARGAVRAFLLTKTKAEVLDAAIERRLLCMSIFDMGDIAASAHLEERDFWATVEIEGRARRIPGRFAQITGGGQPQVLRRAPRIGEHTDEVLRDWLGAAVGPAAALPEQIAASR